jgi:hypothetical protein
MEFYLIRNVGAELVATAGATSKLDFSTGTNYASDFRRQAVLVANSGTAAIYVKVGGRNNGSPTVTSTNYHLQVPVGQSVTLRATREVDLYVNGSSAFTAVELG